MGQIFISYASQDRDFALRLADDLDNAYSIWIDREGIAGGTQWEQRIEQGIAECEVFIVIVSPHSNNSNWVMRETIRAESLSKYRVPVLLDDDLPLRLLDLHYIDFRGNYDGGLRDLLAVIQARLTPKVKDDSDLDHLIGLGVRRYLEGDYPTANSIIGQVSLLSADLGDQLLGMWQLLSDAHQGAPLAEQYLDKIKIIEHAKISTEHVYPNQDTYEWSVELQTLPPILEKIDYVQYQLHPTFSNPTRIMRDRESNFRLNSLGWGTFNIPIEIHFVDGSVGRMEYELSFA